MSSTRSLRNLPSRIIVRALQAESQSLFESFPQVLVDSPTPRQHFAAGGSNTICHPFAPKLVSGHSPASPSLIFNPVIGSSFKEMPSSSSSPGNLVFNVSAQSQHPIATNLSSSPFINVASTSTLEPSAIDLPSSVTKLQLQFYSAALSSSPSASPSHFVLPLNLHETESHVGFNELIVNDTTIALLLQPSNLHLVDIAPITNTSSGMQDMSNQLLVGTTVHASRITSLRKRKVVAQGLSSTNSLNDGISIRSRPKRSCVSHDVSQTAGACDCAVFDKDVILTSKLPQPSSAMSKYPLTSIAPLGACGLFDPVVSLPSVYPHNTVAQVQSTQSNPFNCYVPQISPSAAWPVFDPTLAAIAVQRPKDAPRALMHWSKVVNSPADVSLDSVLHSMFVKEQLYQPLHSTFLLQLEITVRMRAILIDWMMEVSQEFLLCRETLHIAVHLVDRYLSKCKEQFSRGSLQLLGCTSLWMAAKVEETCSPKASDFILTTDSAYSVQQMIEMELHLLGALGWTLCPITAHAFVTLYIKRLAAQLVDIAKQNAITDVLNCLLTELPTRTTSDMHLKVQWQASPIQIQSMTLAESSWAEPEVLQASVVLNTSASISPAYGYQEGYCIHVDIPMSVISLLHMSVFMRVMELLDMALLDLASLKYYPSTLAISALCVVQPFVVNHLSTLCPYSLVQLQSCIAWLASFASLPHRGLLLPLKSFFDVQISRHEYHTRQLHHPQALTLFGFK